MAENTIRFNPISGFLTGDPVISDKIQKDIAGMREDIAGMRAALERRPQGRDEALRRARQRRAAGDLSGGQSGDNSPTIDETNAPTPRPPRPRRRSPPPAPASGTPPDRARDENGRFSGDPAPNNPAPPTPADSEDGEKEKKKNGWFSKIVSGIAGLRDSVNMGNTHGLDPVLDAVSELSGIARMTKKGIEIAYKTVAAPFKAISATYKFFKPNAEAGGSRATLMFRGWRKRAQERQQRTLEKIVNLLKAVGFGSGSSGDDGGLIDYTGEGNRRGRGRRGRGRRGRGWRRAVGALGRFGRSRGGLIGAALGAFSLGDIMTDDTMTGAQKVHATGNLAGSVAGGIGGAALGAAVGTAIFPVVGTVIGGLIGGWLGSKGGEVVADKAQDMLAKTDISGFSARSLLAIGGMLTTFYKTIVDATSQAFEAIANKFKAGITAGHKGYNAAVDATSNGMSWVGGRVDAARRFITGDKSPTVNDVTQPLSGSGGHIGAGNLHKRSVATANSYGAGNIGGLDDKNTRELVASVVSTESSGGDINAKNRFGYFGRYQTGAGYLANAGMIKGGADAVKAAKAADGFAGKSDWAWGESGGQTKFLQNPVNWNNGMTLEKYRADASAQDAVFQKGTTSAYNQLVKDGKITANTPPEVVRGLLKAAHIAGIGGAKAVARGENGASDANGTSARDYYRQGSSNEFADVGTAAASTTVPTVTTPQLNDPITSYYIPPSVTLDAPKTPIASKPAFDSQKGKGKPDQQVSNPRLAQIATGGISDAKLN